MGYEKNMRQKKTELNKNGTPRKHGTTNNVNFRLDRDDIFELKAIAKVNGFPVSTLLRRIVSRWIHGERFRLADKNTVGDFSKTINKVYTETGNVMMKNLTELNKIGINLNQIAKKVNQGFAPVSLGNDVRSWMIIRSECENLLKENLKILSEMKEMVSYGD